MQWNYLTSNILGSLSLNGPSNCGTPGLSFGPPALSACSFSQQMPHISSIPNILALLQLRLHLRIFIHCCVSYTLCVCSCNTLLGLTDGSLILGASSDDPFFLHLHSSQSRLCWVLLLSWNTRTLSDHGYSAFWELVQLNCRQLFVWREPLSFLRQLFFGMKVFSDDYIFMPLEPLGS